MNVDVAIIGGGIAGLSCAYELLKRGKSVAVLEDGIIASGETSRTSAHLSSCLDDRYYEYIERFGLEKARLIAQAQQEAINTIENIIKEERIDCDFKRVDGYLFSHDENQDDLSKEEEALKRLGNISYERLKKAPITTFDSGPCLRFLHQAQFEPMKYIKGLAEAVIKKGGFIFENTHALSIHEKPHCEVSTSSGHRVHAEDIIIATGSPINDRVIMHTKQAQYRTYIIQVALPKGAIKEALYWDTLDKYHYIRIINNSDQEKDYILVGGEDHKVGQKIHPKEAFDNLKKWVKEHFSSPLFISGWSGQVIEPIDRLAFIGLNPGQKHIYIHTGTSGNGLTYGTIASLVLPDLIIDKKSLYEHIYDPSRKTLSSGTEYLKENLNTAAAYTDWLKPSCEKVADLLPNEGIIIKEGLSPKAVYKNKEGTISYLSAICPHLGGIVRWNELEKTWDCPCHGSRFSAEGEVMNGPANSNLKKIKS